MEDAFRRSGGESHYVRCMTEATRIFVEQKRAASDKQSIFTCPPLPDMMNMAQQVMDKASLVAKKKQEFKKLRKSVSGIDKSLREVCSKAVIRNTCGEAVTTLHMPLVEADTLTSQYSAEGWIERRFLIGGDVEFDKKFPPLLSKLEKGGARLIATIKIIKDAVKTGTIAASDPELEGSALTEATLQAHAAITEAGGVDAKAADRTFVAKGKQEIREDLGEEESVASSDAGGTDIGDLDGASNIQAMVKKELEECSGRKPRHKKDKDCGQDKECSPVMLAFAGDFWGIARIGDEGEDPSEMDKSGQTYGVLHQAVFWQDLDGVCLLTGRGLDPDPRTKRLCPTLGVKCGSTPLHLAAIIGNVMIVKQLICDGANVGATDDDGKTPHEVATTNECKAAIEGADRLRGMQVQFGVLVAAGNWEEAMKLIYAVERDASGRAIHIGLPANTVLPGRPRTRAFPEGIPLSERFCAIHVAARQKDIVAYAQLVHAGAIPLQVDGSDTCEGKLPSDLCGEGDVKQILKEIEGLLAPGELDLGRGEVGPNGRYLVKPPAPDPALPELLEEEGESVDEAAEEAAAKVDPFLAARTAVLTFNLRTSMEDWMRTGKVVIVGYHGGCPDGCGAAYMLKTAIKSCHPGIEIKDFPLGHSDQNFTSVVEPEAVVISLDMAPTLKDIDALKTASLVLIMDHHKSETEVLEKLQEAIPTILNMSDLGGNECGSSLVVQLLKDIMPVPFDPKVITMLHKMDVFTFKLPDELKEDYNHFRSFLIQRGERNVQIDLVEKMFTEYEASMEAGRGLFDVILGLTDRQALSAVCVIDEPGFKMLLVEQAEDYGPVDFPRYQEKIDEFKTDTPTLFVTRTHGKLPSGVFNLGLRRAGEGVDITKITLILKATPPFISGGGHPFAGGAQSNTLVSREEIIEIVGAAARKTLADAAAAAG